jgi:hypothetical protein
MLVIGRSSGGEDLSGAGAVPLCTNFFFRSEAESPTKRKDWVTVPAAEGIFICPFSCMLTWVWGSP